MLFMRWRTGCRDRPAHAAGLSLTVTRSRRPRSERETPAPPPVTKCSSTRVFTRARASHQALSAELIGLAQLEDT